MTIWDAVVRACWSKYRMISGTWRCSLILIEWRLQLPTWLCNTYLQPCVRPYRQSDSVIAVTLRYVQRQCVWLQRHLTYRQAGLVQCEVSDLRVIFKCEHVHRVKRRACAASWQERKWKFYKFGKFLCCLFQTIFDSLICAKQLTLVKRSQVTAICGNQQNSNSKNCHNHHLIIKMMPFRACIIIRHCVSNLFQWQLIICSFQSFWFAFRTGFSLKI